MSRQANAEDTIDQELSEDEIFVAPASLLPEQKKKRTTSTHEPPGDSDSFGEPKAAPEGAPQDSARLHEETPRTVRAPWGLTKSGRPRKKPLKQLSDEERAEVAEKRRAALEKGRNARAEKILERKRVVMDFFGEDCLQSNTLKNLEAAMETAKSALKSTEKKIFAKPSRTTVKSERVVGKPAVIPNAREEPPEPAPEKTVLDSKTDFRPVSATPEPIVWRPKPKKRTLW